MTATTPPLGGRRPLALHRQFGGRTANHTVLLRCPLLGALRSLHPAFRSPAAIDLGHGCIPEKGMSANSVCETHVRLRIRVAQLCNDEAVTENHALPAS